MPAAARWFPVRAVFRMAGKPGRRRAGWAALRDRPSVTADGVPLRLMMNAGLTLELDQLNATGAEGIGLFRTEIAMLARGAVADVPEQAALYARVLDLAGDRPGRFRTLDLGGDKLLPDAPPQPLPVAHGFPARMLVPGLYGYVSATK